jgi:hypothetical protein
MTTVTWRAAWEALLEKDMADEHRLRPLHAKYRGRIAENVAKTTLPGTTVATAFGYVVDIGCVDPDHPYVRDFLTWTIDMGEAIRGDAERWKTRWAVLGHAQRSRLNGVLALAYGLRNDSAPDPVRLKASRDDAMVAYAETKGKNWDERDQSEYLVAIQFCLIGGDVSVAREMSGVKRKFGLTRQWHDWLATFVAHIEAAANGRVTDAAVVNAFDEFFDRVRDPRFKRVKEKGKWMSVSLPLLRIQLAILRHKYIYGGAVAGCWSQILRSIAK